MGNDVIYTTDKFKLEKVLADKSIPPGAKLILLNLMYRTGLKNYAFPSQKKISKDVGLKERQVRNHLNKLKNKGIISWSRKIVDPKTGKKINSNTYDLSNILRKTRKK